MDRRPNRWSRLLIAFMVALFCAGTATVVTAAEDYNDNWVYCRGASTWDPLYWYFRCYLPEDPRNGQA